MRSVLVAVSIFALGIAVASQGAEAKPRAASKAGASTAKHKYSAAHGSARRGGDGGIHPLVGSGDY